LEHLARRFVEREYPAGHAIVTQGAGGEGFFIIASGRAEAIRERADGSKALVNTFGPTDFFGELALLDDGLRTASVVTTEPTRCLVLTRWDFLAALREDPEMAITVLQELARRFRRALEAL
ncbi:MAG: cyclic nucleotide-binding domain-containing protein, partial [Anaerolineae bacterium]|nr:cyclic nucleotide-binding domain-containing protein [Candidatus Roseilinea sp.]MDW8449333.1 cyclic nucleotide-binding domain-containing protein [Anaerolineae bacterium]